MRLQPVTLPSSLTFLLCEMGTGKISSQGHCIVCGEVCCSSMVVSQHPWDAVCPARGVCQDAAVGRTGSYGWEPAGAAHFIDRDGKVKATQV